MERQENVYAEVGTEDTATAEKDMNNASAVPQKFKDVDALARAYGSLQAEFTRRSQRLKELEREVENFKNGAETDAFGAEKRRRKADERKEEGRKFDEFLSSIERDATEEKPLETPETEVRSVEKSHHGEEKTVGKGRVETKLSTDAAAETEEGEALALGSVASGREIAEPSGDQLYDIIRKNEDVRLRIIGEYLSSLARDNAPLMRGGASALASPPRKAKTVSEAGGMALRFFQNGNGQA